LAFHAFPEAAQAPFSSVFAQQLVFAAESDPPRAVAHERKRRDDARFSGAEKIRSDYVAVCRLDFLADERQDAGVVFQKSAAIRPGQLFERGGESAISDL